MQLNKPQVKRIHVTAYDRVKGKSKTLTVYGSDLEHVVKSIRESIQGNSPTTVSANATT